MTEGTFGDIRSSGPFDEWAPENIAPLVGYLATDDAASITGQVFYVAGGTVQLYQGWGPVAEARKDDRWTVAELVKEVPGLFGDRPSAYAPQASQLRASLKEN